MRKIGLLGATGYTGRLTATEFAVREIPVRLGARSAERLSRVDAAEGSERVVVDTTDRGALEEFLDGLDLVISTVGPFVTLGRPVLTAAVDAGVHYIDSTGEPDFMRWAYEEYADAATAVVPACGFDYVPSDAAAAVAATALDGPAEHIRIDYAVSGMRPTRGTARSALGALVSEPNPRLRRTEIAGRPALQMPLADGMVIGRWAPHAEVVCAGAVPRAMSLVAPLFGPATKPMLRLSAPALRRLVERMPEGPSDADRARAHATIVASASRGSQTESVTVEVDDVYAFTALSLVEFALRAEGKGAVAPSQVVDPVELLDALSGPLLAWRR